MTEFMAPEVAREREEKKERVKVTELMANEVSVSILIDKLVNLQDQQRIVNPRLRKRIDGAIPKLQEIQELLKYAANKKESETLSEWMVQLLRAVYQAEDSIDTFLVSTTSPQQRHSGLIKKLFISIWSPARRGILFSNEMERFLNQFTRLSSDDGFSMLQGLCQKDLGQKLHENAIGEPSSRNGQEGRHQRRWGRISHYLDETSELVGREDEKKRMKFMISIPRKVVLVVVGDQGSGKTALVRAVYDEIQNANYVHCAWVHASREYLFRPLMLDIWKQVLMQVNDLESSLFLKELEDLPENKLASTGYFDDWKRGQFKWFLVVLDDVCLEQNMQLVHRIVDSLPLCTVIVTTCYPELAKHAGENYKLYYQKENYKVFQLRLLTSEESWELFLRKVGELVDPADDNLRGKIYEITQGSPMAIILLRGMLSFTESSEWSRMIDLILSRKDQPPSSPTRAASEDVRPISENFLNILALSNHALPSSLKPLLLYFGLFPNAFDIPIRRLLRLWLGEGLVTRHKKEVEPEDLAERYLQQLVTSELVEVARWSLDGSPRTCRMPGRLYDIFFPKGLDIGFYHIHDHDHYEPKPKFEVRRVAEYLDINSYPRSDPYIQHLRSYVSFNTRNRDTPAQQIGEFLNKIIARKGFKLLRVLDLEGVFKPMLPETLGLMLHLVYIGLRWTFLDSLPMSVGNLPCLETLDVKHTNITTLPSSIWKVENLRHLYLNNIVRLDMPNQNLSDRFSKDLKTLSGLRLGKKSSFTNGLDRLHGLGKLGLTFDSTLAGAIAKWISQLTGLQSLKLRSTTDFDFSRPSDLSLEPLAEHHKLSDLYLLGILQTEVAEIGFPSNLKVLTLSLSQLKEDPMPTLGKLPQLNTLRLFGSSYLGNRMTCDHGSFPELLVLKLWKLENLEKWKVEEEALPHLQELEIRCCEKLKEVTGLEQVQSLKELILTNMPEEFVKEVEMGKHRNVHIRVNKWQISPYQENKISRQP